jgi:hypothetical protein
VDLCLRLQPTRHVYTRDTNAVIQLLGIGVWPISPSIDPNRNILTPVIGYTNSELVVAVNISSPYVPALNTLQLLNVLYMCMDIQGTIAANSFCIAGCIDEGPIATNDMCAKWILFGFAYNTTVSIVPWVFRIDTALSSETIIRRGVLAALRLVYLSVYGRGFEAIWAHICSVRGFDPQLGYFNVYLCPDERVGAHN